MWSNPQLSVVRGSSVSLPRETHLSRIFEENAFKSPNSTAVIYKGGDGTVHTLTYNQLDRKANQVARAMLSHLGDHSRADCLVALSLPPNVAMVVTLVATWKAGAAYLPLDLQAAHRVQHIVQEAKPDLIIKEKEGENCEEVLRSQNTVSISELEEEAAKMADTTLSDDEMLPNNNGQVLGIVMYTSGSTGMPKGVRLPHRAILNRLHWQWRQFPYSQTELVCVLKTVLTFVDAVCEVWGPLLNPSPIAVLVLPRDVTKDPQRLISVMDEYKLERITVIPSLLRAILLFLETTHQLKHLKLVMSSSEPLSKSLAQEFLDRFSNQNVDLCNLYGLTETMADVTYHVIHSSGDLTFAVPVGRPLDNTIIYLLNKQLHPVPVGEVGELYVSGLNICDGYVNNRDPHKFVANPNIVDHEHSLLYNTGDYGRLVKGTVLYEGRKDSQVKVRGHRVDLAEVDAALTKLLEVDQTVVLCYRPGELEQAVVAYVTQRPEASCSAEDIETSLQSHLAVYVIPQVFIIDSIPLLYNGKVDRQTLIEKYAQLASTNSDVSNVELNLNDLPEDKKPQAKCLLRTVASVLGASARGKISLDGNFYHLGGTSLNSVLTVTKLRDQGYVIGVTDFICAQTLRQVVEMMVPEDRLTDVQTITSTPKQKKYICEIIQKRHKEDVYRIISDGFYEKGDLDQFIRPRIQKRDYEELLDQIWEPVLKQKLSLVLRSGTTQKVVSEVICFDGHDISPVHLSSSLNIMLEFMEHLEAPIRDQKLPQGKGKVLFTFMEGTDKSLTAAENVETMQVMEEEVFKMAKSMGFKGIFTTNTSPLTQQLGVDVYNYKVMTEVQANKYKAPDGSRPFSRAPDSLRVNCCWREIV